LIEKILKLFVDICLGLIKGVLYVMVELFKFCWQEPAEARGPVWTLALWLFVACVSYLTYLLYQTHKPVTLPLVVAVLAYMVMGKAGKEGPGTRRVFGRRR
jgi:quinol-cytochrome oxidoreductase complex cytochrome b subunit